MRAVVLAMLGMLAACNKAGEEDDEPKLSHRSRDAGPAVVFVDRTSAGGGPAPVEEKEPNGKKSPQPLPVPGAVSGKIDAGDDWDVYEVQLAKAGMFSIRLSAVDDADLILELSDGSGDVLAVSDNGPAKVAEALPNVFAQPGSYQIAVHEFVKAPAKKRDKPDKKETTPAGRSGPSGAYQLSIDVLPVPEAGEERERNDQSAFADELALGAAGRGFVGWRKDVDYWKIALEGMRPDEVLSVEVSGLPGVALRLSLVDAAGKTLVERKGRTGQPLSLGSVAVPEQTAFVFAVVSGDLPNVEERYTIQARVRAAQLDEESEPNDTPETASALGDVPGADSGARIGTLAGTDVDYYRLDPAPGTRSLSVTIEPPAGLDVELTLVDAGGKALLGPVDLAKKGGAEKIVGAEVGPNATVFVRVRPRGGAAAEPYRLKWSAAGSAPE